MLWDGDLPIQEYSDTHVYTTIYEQGSFEPVARLAWLRDDIPEVANDQHGNDEGWYGNDKPATKTGIQVYHYHNDQLGTPNELTNDKGEVVWLADYQAWGNTAKVIWREQLIDQIQVSQDELQPIRFQGQHFDTETGLHYNRFRYFDPDMGMFTSRDPIGLMGGDNVFAYAPNPTGFTDPLGLSRGGNGGDGSAGGKNTSNPYKHCKQHPTKPNMLQCKDKHSGKTKEVPKPDNWDALNNKSVVCDDCVKTAGKVAGAAGAGYIIYRGVRMIPSIVIPALWPSIPANAAIP